MARTKSRRPASGRREKTAHATTTTPKKISSSAPAGAATRMTTTTKTLLRERDGSSDEEEEDVASRLHRGGADIDGGEEDDDALDETEEALERAVFGDDNGWRAGLRNMQVATLGAQGEEEEEGQGQGKREEEDLGALAHADLFFTDVGPAAVDAEMLKGFEAGESDDEAAGRVVPAWEDSDDERLAVSLASVPRLRKLRRTEAEDVVSGKEYVRRLRKHFEVLNPVPEWASEALTAAAATQKPARKKRRLTMDGEAVSDEDMSDEDVDMDDDELSADPLAKLLQDSQGLVRRNDTGGKKRKLRPEVLDIQRTKDIPGTQPSAITSLSFHPNLPLLLSSGPASTLYLHHIIGAPPAAEANPLLTSLHIKKTPLTTTAFHPIDSRIFLSARRRYFHVWDLDSGRVEKVARIYGHQHEQRSMERFKLSPDGRSMALLGSARKGGGVVNILDAHTLQWSTQVRVESRGGIAELAWWRDSRGLCIVGKNGEVTEYSLAEQRAVARWQDEGAVGTTTIALGGDNGQAGSLIGKDRWVAIGSSSGIVNIYDRRAWLVSAAAAGTSGTSSVVPEHPAPTRTIDNLTTPTSHLAFSPDGQLMVMASRWKKDALRLVHLPSCTVYKNWPTSNTPLGRITGVAFAPGSDALAVANEAGKIRLWEIRA